MCFEVKPPPVSEYQSIETCALIAKWGSRLVTFGERAQRNPQSLGYM